MTSLTTQAGTAEAMAIKGRMVSLTVLELFSTDLGAFDRQLEEKAAQAPMFFRNAPVLLDFEGLDQEVDILGDYVQFVWRNGATAASGRVHLYLRP